MVLIAAQSAAVTALTPVHSYASIVAVGCGNHATLASAVVDSEAAAARPKATAVFCANDHIALGLLRALQNAGVSVLHDVSLIGFDDIPEAEFFGPPLTTVRQDFGEVGRRAIDTLARLIDEGLDLGARHARTAASASTLVDAGLIVRSSCAPPRQAALP